MHNTLRMQVFLPKFCPEFFFFSGSVKVSHSLHWAGPYLKRWLPYLTRFSQNNFIFWIPRTLGSAPPHPLSEPPLVVETNTEQKGVEEGGRGVGIDLLPQEAKLITVTAGNPCSPPSPPRSHTRRGALRRRRRPALATNYGGDIPFWAALKEREREECWLG